MRGLNLPRTALSVAVFIFLLTNVAEGAITRKHFIASEEIDWQYTNGDMSNLLDLNDQSSAEAFLRTSRDRIGATYKKAIYEEYTDNTFTQKKKKPPSRGLVGPLLRAEIGDTVEITYFNNASREYSLHPHGLFYLKQHEGAIYLDGTSGRRKYDDIVFPGETVKLIWNVTESDAPGPDDPNCIPWVYHSHLNTVRDTSAGMMGVMITCRPGTLDSNGKRKDVEVEYPLLVKIWDENLSWYIDENAGRCLSPSACQKLKEDEDEGFIEINYMAAINGFMFGHLPDLSACVGRKVAFYLVGMGNEFDIHSLHFHGQNLHYQHTRGDTVSVFSATFVAAETTPLVAGYWRVTDMVGENEKNGMGAYLFTRNCNRRVWRAQNKGTLREYFLSAEKIMWNYGPTGVDTRGLHLLKDPTSVSNKFFENSSTRIGGVYYKAKFIAYNDSSFTAVMTSEEDEHLGLLGPVLRAEVGDTLQVTVKNNISSTISLLPHGLQYSPFEEVVGDIGRPVGGRILPGHYHTYVFQVPDDLVDNTTEPCRNYLYTSAFDPLRDHNTGLVGPLLVCRKGYLASTAPKPKEKFLLFQTFDENKSVFLNDNIRYFLSQAIGTAGPNTGILAVDTSDPDFQESNLMYSINGFSFGNIPGLKTCLGDDVTWYVMGMGGTSDMHTATFDGNSYTKDGTHRDTRTIVPGSTAALPMTVDNPGRWVVESHSNLARENGMFGFYDVQLCGQSPTTFSTTGTTREVFIAAEEVDWDFAPLERSLISGADLNDPRNDANIFVKDDEDFIGDVYKKAVYREYTDSSFTTRKTPHQSDLHLDLLGPAIRAEVGDTIRVHFKNMASRPYSVHTHGLRYSEADSGANYKQNQGVTPGQTKVYTWEVPERSGPGPKDPNCIPWVYYSAIDPVKDTNSGLIGMTVICRRGILDSEGKRTDMAHEYFILMSVINENLSWYLADNVATFAPNRIGTDYASDGDFEESNKMHSINGRLHGNAPHLVMEYNETVAWYFASMGAEVDLHSFHMHGHTVLHTSVGHRDDAINISPGQAEAMEMIADNPGTWLLHCHVLDHIVAGMETTYTVLKPGEAVNVNGPSQNIHIG
ncbi:hephaestin-like protein [Aplysia californica]|uniref:Hephaestin-like protein n=1 Tax=Aplysia californica TaxID=6500 RepID=A0ABM0ZX51_APLCA|nr:hephaestin-like protein [Aplysia californica]